MNAFETPAELAGFPIVRPIVIQWGDQDAFGHVNNTVFLRWFETARIAYLEETGMETLMTKEGLGPILASITCHYRSQLHYPDTVLVGARITRIGRASMTMCHAVYSVQRRTLAADGDSVVVMFDYQKNKSEPVPDSIRQLIDRVESRAAHGP